MQDRIENGLRLEPLLRPHSPANATIAEAMRRYQVPGCSIAVIDDGQIAWTQGYGVVRSDQANAPAVAPDTIFQACSISKAVAAVAALRLVQAGKLKLDEDINARLRSWRVPMNGAWQPRVTLRHLLSHAGGLTYCWYPGYQRGAEVPTLLQILEGAPPANTPAVRVTAIPGVQFRYSGSHYSVLQQLLIDVAEQPFPELMRALVFEPLGMQHSGYASFPDTHASAVALGHDGGGRPIDGGWRVMPEFAGAGLWTTPSDLARLALDIQAAVSGGASQVLGRAIVRQMLMPQIADRGLGWRLEGTGSRQRFVHGGDNIGYKCRLIAYARRGSGAVLMTNGDEGNHLVDEIVRVIGEEYTWPAPDADADVKLLPPEEEPAEAARERLRTFVGQYRLESGMIFAVALEGDTLVLSPPDQPAIALRPLSEHVYAAEVVNTLVTFMPSAAGVAGFELRQQDDDLFAEKIA